MRYITCGSECRRVMQRCSEQQVPEENHSAKTIAASANVWRWPLFCNRGQGCNTVQHVATAHVAPG